MFRCIIILVTKSIAKGEQLCGLNHQQLKCVSALKLQCMYVTS